MAALLQLGQGDVAKIFMPGDLRKDLQLLEADEHVLTSLLEEGVSIKGSSRTDAVLTTRTATFALKHVETTNALLLIKPRRDGCQTEPDVRITASAANHWELTQVSGRFETLDALFLRCDVTLDAAGALIEGMPSFTFQELLERVQASPAELLSALQRLGAYEVEGRWTVLDSAVQDTVLELILLTAVQHGWNLSTLPSQEMAAALQGDDFEPRVVLHCLSLYSTPTEGCDENTRSIDEKKVCLHYANKLLHEPRKWPLDDFMSRWTECVPEDMCPTMDMLEGFALVSTAGDEATIKLFTASALPRDPPTRFAELFKARQRWEYADLLPYLTDLAADQAATEGLLLSFARASQAQPGALVTYSAR
ncbi:hypothetical protein WJX72_005883 [[Myrmecia] bisecta]|uniref:Sister chromatid cohesion protein DCC1 n=1 Tax=[Myrmecia] bisecta TaxID=41462 RepID=A0AAW1PWU1_9CHLO